MNTRILGAVALLALGGGIETAMAQGAAPLLGKWTVEYEQGRRIENDEVTTIMAKGVLTITQAGDSLTAVINGRSGPDGSALPPTTLNGRMTSEGAVFYQKRQVTVNENGEMSTREITLTWNLQAAGDALTGSIKTDFGGDHGGSPSPVKGTRIKA